MKVTEKDIFEKCFAPLGLKVGDKIVIPELTDDKYEVVAEGYTKLGEQISTLSSIVELDFKIVRKTKEEIHEELKKMAGDWEPNWEDSDERKWIIAWFSEDEQPATVFTVTLKHANTIHFRSKEEAQKAIDSFTEEEWKRYFEVE